MENSFARACTEVLEVLKYLPRDEYEKIPQYEIELLENQKDSSYEFALDSEEKYKKISRILAGVVYILTLIFMEIDKLRELSAYTCSSLFWINMMLCLGVLKQLFSKGD